MVEVNGRYGDGGGGCDLVDVVIIVSDHGGGGQRW